MASFSKSLFTQWVKAVPSSPWSSNSAPDSLSQPKCFRTCENKIWSKSHPKLRSYLLPHPWCDDNINLLGAEASPDIWTPANDQDVDNCYFFSEEDRTCEQLDIASPSESSSHSTGAFAVPRSDAVSRCLPVELVAHRPEVDYYRLSVR